MNLIPVLSLYSGIGLLDSGFERQGFCVVRGPEKLLGGDIRNFHAASGIFSGVIGGSPCQDFSRARRTPPTGEGIELLNEFCRVVIEAQADFFLHENVPGVPDIAIDGYYIQRFELSPTHLGHSQNRPRHFQFGSKTGLILDIQRRAFLGTVQPCLTASEGNKPGRRNWVDFCRLQGLPGAVALPDLNQVARYRAVGNGVHTAVAFEVARAIREVLTSPNPRTIFNTRLCACGCGRTVSGKQKSATATCRKRLEVRRKRVNLPARPSLVESQV